MKNIDAIIGFEKNNVNTTDIKTKSIILFFEIVIFLFSRNLFNLVYFNIKEI